METENVTERETFSDFNCDMCCKNGMDLVPAKYDAKTKIGPWAYMCEACFKKWGMGLGLGKGQKLKKVQDDE